MYATLYFCYFGFLIWWRQTVDSIIFNNEALLAALAETKTVVRRMNEKKNNEKENKTIWIYEMNENKHA